MQANSPQLIQVDQIKMILDPARIDREYQTFLADEDAYIERRFADLRDWDFPVYCAVNITITTKDGRAIPFILNRVQLEFLRCILEDLAAGKPVRILVVKDRQLGVSTIILIFFYWLTSLRPNRNTIVITHDMDSVHDFSSRLAAVIDEANDMLTPEIKAARREVIHFATPSGRGGHRKRGQGAGQNSKIRFFTCKKVSLGRSFTIQYAHISEAAFYGDLKPKVSVKKLLGSLAHAIPKVPGSILVIETTPNGLNEVAEIWDKATKGINEFRPVFLSSIGSDEYRDPLPENQTLDLCEAEESSGVPTRWGNEVAESKLIREELIKWYPDFYAKWGDKWLDREILARLNWRRQYIDGPCNGDKALFRREFPLTPQQGFEATGKNCFDLRSIGLMRKRVEEEGVQPRRYAYVGDPDSDNPKDQFRPDDYGPLVVYEGRREGVQYVLAADPAMGNPNSDPSALIVYAVSETEPHLREVASYNKIIKPDVFADLIYYLGKGYNNALVVVEDNPAGGGPIVNLHLHRQAKYERIYFRLDPYDKKAAPRPGFVTHERNRGTIITGLDLRIRNGEILLRTPLLLEQLEHFVELENGDMGAEPGYNDDLAMAAMIGVNASLRVYEQVIREGPPPGSVGDLKKKGVFKRGRR
jgi:hypothetical protein